MAHWAAEIFKEKPGEVEEESWAEAYNREHREHLRELIETAEANPDEKIEVAVSDFGTDLIANAERQFETRGFEDVPRNAVALLAHEQADRERASAKCHAKQLKRFRKSIGLE